MFRPNPAFHRELEAQPEHDEALKRSARRVAHIGKAFAPKKTGYYARRFTVVEENGEVRVGNKDFAAHLVEWGSKNNPPYAVLRRAARAAGLRLREHSK